MMIFSCLILLEIILGFIQIGWAERKYQTVNSAKRGCLYIVMAKLSYQFGHNYVFIYIYGQIESLWSNSSLAERKNWP